MQSSRKPPSCAGISWRRALRSSWSFSRPVREFQNTGRLDRRESRRERAARRLAGPLSNRRRAAYAPERLIQLYGQMDAYIGMRLHGAILAMLGGTPAMAIAYEEKTPGIFASLGLEAFQVDHRRQRAPVGGVCREVHPAHRRDSPRNFRSCSTRPPRSSRSRSELWPRYDGRTPAKIVTCRDNRPHPLGLTGSHNASSEVD